MNQHLSGGVVTKVGEVSVPFAQRPEFQNLGL